jgi:hypothetical protein
MHSSQHLEIPEQRPAGGIEILSLSWLHGALAITCGVLGGMGVIPVMLGLVGMAIFGGVGVLFAMLTLTRL